MTLDRPYVASYIEDVDLIEPPYLTFSYNTNTFFRIELDLYLPPPSPESPPLPLLVYFHGGGLTVGDRTSWFPSWLHKRAMAAGYAFISADYRLMPPSTGHELIEDIQGLFRCVRYSVNNFLRHRRRDACIDRNNVAVAGSSAGGLCAYLAGIHVTPKPRAILSIYGMGGDFFTPHYIAPKVTPFFRGRELLDPASFPEFLYPDSTKLDPTTSSPLSYHGNDYTIPGLPSNPRMFLGRLYLQLGVFIDYYTGQHEPSVSERLRTCLGTPNNSKSWVSMIPTIHRPLFPQLHLSKFPPTFLIHGSEDTAVPIQESYKIHNGLESRRIPVVLKVCEGMEHSFDYHAEAEQQWGTVFDEAFLFIRENMSSTAESDASE